MTMLHMETNPHELVEKQMREWVDALGAKDVKWVTATALVNPRGQGRGRAAARTDSSGRTYATVYKTKEDRHYETAVREVFYDLFDGKIYDCPVIFGATYNTSRPKRLQRKKDPDGWIYHTKKPDKDNMDKAAMDAVQFYFSDDKVFFAGNSAKWYAPKGETSSVTITVALLLGEPT